MRVILSSGARADLGDIRAYLILFSIENGLVAVHRVVQGARDYPALFPSSED